MVEDFVDREGEVEEEFDFLKAKKNIVEDSEEEDTGEIIPGDDAEFEVGDFVDPEEVEEGSFALHSGEEDDYSLQF